MIILTHYISSKKKLNLLIVTCLLFVFAVTSVIFKNPVQAERLIIDGVIPANRKVAYSYMPTEESLIFSAIKGTSTDDLGYKLKVKALKSEIGENYNYDEDLVPSSDLYSVTIATTSQEVVKSFRPQITLKYPKDNKLRNIYLWDRLSNNFIKINGQKDLKNPSVVLNLYDYGEIIFGLFEEKSAQGRASWYVHPRYPKELIAASTQFSRGAKVKVTNLANNKSVIVTIKDWGPDPIIHPDRVVDLSKEAFKRIASTRAGVIDVLVEPVAEPIIELDTK